MYRWENNYTGELYRNLYHALTTIIEDIVVNPKCRTLKMFSIKKVK